jgi:hypothetical protein
VTDQPITKLGRNERRKLTAASWNAVGLAFVAIGFVQPAITGVLTVESAVKLAIAALIGYILHRHALNLLSGLEE